MSRNFSCFENKQSCHHFLNFNIAFFMMVLFISFHESVLLFVDVFENDLYILKNLVDFLLTRGWRNQGNQYAMALLSKTFRKYSVLGN